MTKMYEHIKESNAIEDVYDLKSYIYSLKAWDFLATPGPLNWVTVMHLHSMITDGQLEPKDQGVVRKVQVYVGDYTPPAPLVAKAQLEDWLKSMEHPENVDPKAAHIRFEKIHPFIDGNGRTGRMLMWWHQLERGEEPTLLKASERQEYYQWFK